MDTQAKARPFRGDSTSHKTLTSEYLEWEAKLTELSGILMVKIHSRLYKRYKNKTRLDPWLNYRSSQIEENTNDYMSHDCIIKIFKFSEEKDIIIEIPETGLRQYAIKHKMDLEKFSVITKAEKNRWTMKCFHRDLKRDIHFYHGRIESKEDPRKYREFLTDRERLVGEELLRYSMVKSGLSTA
ncbi:2105_t:CDS:2 [Cetraspora pellucida]|uniref:2105_t:CDS:1 n=1 Tax=Cetraspora pellucida TaxID=1433469 RepID=A0ACA9LNA7_9GLOM|nr:2105_t:CDS:2 [Cetraspora pellucida]